MSETAVETPQAAATALVNSVVKNLCALAARAWAKRWIITFTAPTGVGKTTAVDYAEQTLGFDHQVIRCKQITTRYTLLQALALAPGEKWNTHGRNWMRASDLYDRALGTNPPAALTFSSLTRLTVCAWTALKFCGIFGMTPGCPMLLVGNEVLTEKINRQHERLFRRIRVRFEQRPLREADLRKVLEFMGYTIADDEFTLLWKLVGGSPGFAEALLENANEIAASQGCEARNRSPGRRSALLPHAQDSGISL